MKIEKVIFIYDMFLSCRRAIGAFKIGYNFTTDYLIEFSENTALLKSHQFSKILPTAIDFYSGWVMFNLVSKSNC